MARKIFHDKFATADAGISGVNFAVAETGTICLLENEGNGQLCTTAPNIHIAKLSDIPPLLIILTRTATGQSISTYFNMISHPRKDDEKDGTQLVNLVFWIINALK